MGAAGEQFEKTVAKIEAENARDPNQIKVGGEQLPRELFYGRRLTEWVLALNPSASEALLLAARAQHIRRWEIKRDTYAMDKAGYHRWKNALKKFHAEVTGQILREGGYGEAMIKAVEELNLKTARNEDAQTLEDALCLLFLEHQLDELMAKTTEEKVVNALRKSWSKMSKKGRELAGKITLTPSAQRLLELALSAS
jgi:hypothetical protein